ncbi:nitrile hydratase [Nocardioides ginsengisegetis]|uniref:Nitrile hydratase n=1 Tax=Nocardioides ginsengisegetis TaxID=661491 RepID=A0A7W3PAU4_9ACTN|nr:nitrile hydratase accessory protein [Nocardioides ginsengisegetis]MBA8804839.1 nitrile hydratase [Nocardioides ginsengisegetis]
MTAGFGSPSTTLEQRDEVESLISDLGFHPEELVFDEPWELRAFALAVAAHTSGRYAWPEFQQALASSIKAWEDSVEDLADPSWSYFEHWVNALQQVLEHAGQVDSGTLHSRTQVVLDAPANRNHHEPHYEPVAVDPALTNRTGARA